MAYRIAVVDDEEDDLKHVCHHISDFFSEYYGVARPLHTVK